MKKVELISSSVIALLFAFGIMANDKKTENTAKAEFDINSLVIVEEEKEIDLGFDTAKYLPENFDPYAFPQHVDGFNYIDENDIIELDFDPSEHLPEGFDPYIRTEK